MEKKTIYNFIFYWLPLIVWMSAIFYFSSHPHFEISDITTLDFIIFKTLHMIEYAFLFYLWFRAIYKSTTISKKHALLAAIIFTVLYATTDELHQTFVPTREGRLRDVFIDFAGVLIIWYYIKSNFQFVTKHLL